MTTRPRVLVPLGTDKNDGNIGHGEVHFARKNYLEKLFNVDLVPVMISPFTDTADALSILEECSGLFLMGGDDVDASHYGQLNHEKNVIVIPERDQLELTLTRKALETKTPLLGICRGAQIMAVATGGTLEQHLPDNPIASTHAQAEYVNYDSWVSSVEHHITVEPSSQAALILGNPSQPLMINSAHHQAIATTNEPFRPVAYSSDRIIEIIEHMNSKIFAFGIQSHPEVLENGALEPFFAAFAEACCGTLSHKT